MEGEKLSGVVAAEGCSVASTSACHDSDVGHVAAGHMALISNEDAAADGALLVAMVDGDGSQGGRITSAAGQCGLVCHRVASGRFQVVSIFLLNPSNGRIIFYEPDFVLRVLALCIAWTSADSKPCNEMMSDEIRQKIIQYHNQRRDELTEGQVRARSK
ncbi:hypothetical protein Aduo_003051 [Ancylostoma duodenale]